MSAFNSLGRVQEKSSRNNQGLKELPYAEARTVLSKRSSLQADPHSSSRAMFRVSLHGAEQISTWQDPLAGW